MHDLDAYTRPGSLPESLSIRVGRMLDLPEKAARDQATLATHVAKGLSTDSAYRIALMLGRARVIGPVIPEATLRRAKRQQKPLSREHSERLYELSRVIDRCARIFHGERESIDTFLHRAHPLLNGATPFEMARSSSAGADAVHELLHGIEAGTPV